MRLDLRVGDRPVALEAKPLELLHELLLKAGEVVTKDELLDVVWPRVTVVESSLATAISKLRKALGDGAGTIIETVPRIGYRLVARVTVGSLAAPLGPRFAFAAGDFVPGRPQWRMLEPLSDGDAQDVWRAEHCATCETRMFKVGITVTVAEASLAAAAALAPAPAHPAQLAAEE